MSSVATVQTVTRRVSRFHLLTQEPFGLEKAGGGSVVRARKRSQAH